MSTKIALPWFEDLTDSVRALGEAAREYQLAYATARTLGASVEIDRRRLQEGKVAGALRPHEAGWPAAREPHADAVFDLQAIYQDHEFKVHMLYAHAALLYASGCAWAVRTIQQGGNPNGVLLPRGNDNGLVPSGFEISGLERYSGTEKLAVAYEQLAVCIGASEHGVELGGRDYLADHEASEMHDALDIASHTADAAFAYGLLAERAVQFVLLEPRRQYRRREVEDAQSA